MSSTAPIAIEDMIADFIKALPQIVKSARKKGCQVEVSDSEIITVACAIWLFLLVVRIPADREGDRRRERATELMWSEITELGEDLRAAKRWFATFMVAEEVAKEAQIGGDVPVDRVAMINDAVRYILFASAEPSSLDFLPSTSSNVVDRFHGFTIRGDN
jgi:hypothetical protein